MITKIKNAAILQILLYLSPMNIYLIGDRMGSGIQWLFFRYHQTSIGNGFILLNREIVFVTSGVLIGRSAIATLIDVIGVGLIVVATLLIAMDYLNDKSAYLKWAAMINFAGAIVLLISALFQYGITLQGLSGIDIPFGVPIILIIAFWQYRLASAPPTEAETNADPA